MLRSYSSNEQPPRVRRPRREGYPVMALPALPPRDLLIDGEWVPGDGDAFEVENPSDGSVLATLRSAGAADVSRAVDSARRAFEHGPWSRLSGADRGQIGRA